MKANPKLWIALVAVIALAAFVKLSNPHRKYSTQQYWAQATVDDVADVPAKALEPGNRNGAVLMWAAMGARDPEILRRLVERGAQVEEVDLLGGTPMSGAAGKSAHPEMITMLASLGADVNKVVNFNSTPAMVAAEYNRNPGIIEALAAAGADFTLRNALGETALDVARMHENQVVIDALAQLDAEPE
jgi:ankyrin repeat protein